MSGAALFVDDLPIEGVWHGATVRCPLPAARVVHIDPSAALTDPAVVVLTAADLPGPNVLRLIADDWPVLAAQRVNHACEAVALVAAPTRARARAAARAVKVDYEALPAVLTLAAALSADSPQVLAQCAIERGDVEEALRAADAIIEGTYETGLQEHIYIEPQGMVAIPHADGRIEVIGSMQCPFYVHKALAHMLGVADDQVRVRQSVTGGGFGGKEDYPDMIAAHAVLLAQRAGRPVKIVYDRHEDIVATTKRHPSRVHHRTGVTRDGKVVAMDIDVALDGGAYVTLSPVVLSRSVLHAGGPYACPNVRVRGRVLATNSPPAGAFRGFGAPQSQFAVERHMDRIARALGSDPLAVRLANAYRLGDTTPTGQELTESVSARECLEEAVRRSGFARKWRDYAAARRPSAADGRPLKGIGLSLYWHGAGFTGNGERLMRSPAAVRIEAGGSFRVLVSSADFGQGTVAVLAQIVADSIGVPIEQVCVAEPDTGLVPDSGPTVASRTVMIVGGVLARAGAEIAKRLCHFLASERGVAAERVTIANGAVRVDGELAAGVATIADRYLAAGGEAEVELRHQPRPDQSFDEATYTGTAYPVYGWGCDVVEVSVDPDTLEITPEKATLVCDVGRAIHPILCTGQIEGGTLQALSWGYMEEMKTEGGRYLNDRLATYIIPTSRDTPAMDVGLIENPASCGPFGAKGIGELPMDGGAPAIVAAIENATGIVTASLPATPERLLEDHARGQRVEGAVDLGDVS